MEGARVEAEEGAVEPEAGRSERPVVLRVAGGGLPEVRAPHGGEFGEGGLRPARLDQVVVVPDEAGIEGRGIEEPGQEDDGNQVRPVGEDAGGGRGE